MRKIYYTLFILFFTTSFFAQQNLLLVEYKENTDTFYLKETVKAYLTANASDSYFISLKTREKGETIYNEDKVVFIGKEKQINEEIFMDFKEKLLNEHYYYSNTKEYFNITEQLPKMKWQLGKESKTINNYKCNKATVYFRGRNYIAWYTTQIPISVGPWKFYGLPGLILEIADETNAFRWEATAVTYPYKENMTLPKPNNINFGSIKLKELESYRLEIAEKEARITASRMPSGVTLVGTGITKEGRELLYEWEANYPKDK